MIRRFQFRMARFLLWLFPHYYAQTASCVSCGDVRCRSRMYKAKVYGWFCDEAEFIQYWEDFQL